MATRKKRKDAGKITARCRNHPDRPVWKPKVLHCYECHRSTQERIHGMRAAEVERRLAIVAANESLPHWLKREVI